jgi:hypothetical protein
MASMPIRIESAFLLHFQAKPRPDVTATVTGGVGQLGGIAAGAVRQIHRHFGVVAAAAAGTGSTQFLRWEHLTILIKQASLNRDGATAPPAGRMKSAEH